MVVHRNLEVPTSEVRIRGIDTEALTFPPRNLENVQKDCYGGEITKTPTGESSLDVGEGAATTRSTSNPRVSQVVNLE